MQICLTWCNSHKEQTKKLDFWKKRSKNDLDMDRTCPGEVIGTWYQPSWVPSLSWRLAAPAAGSGDHPAENLLVTVCVFCLWALLVSKLFVLESRGCKQIAGNFKGFSDVMYFKSFASSEVCQNCINALYALYKPTIVNMKQT